MSLFLTWLKLGPYLVILLHDAECQVLCWFALGASPALSSRVTHKIRYLHRRGKHVAPDLQ